MSADRKYRSYPRSSALIGGLKTVFPQRSAIA
jgi:hypothetical protein